MGVVELVAASLAREPEAAGRVDLAERAGRILALEAPRGDPSLVRQVVDRFVGLGPLQPLLGDETVTDILVNGPDEVWVDRGQELERVDVAFGSPADLMATIERAISTLGLRIDRSSPIVDGRLADGSRIHIAIPPATVDHPVVAIRRFSPTVTDLDQMVGSGSVTLEQCAFLRAAVRDRSNLVVSGGTGTGKTTLLNVLAAEIPRSERVVTVEDAAELAFPGHVVRLEARPPNAEGFGELTIRQLLRSALRLRPDRLVLGEVRGPEALDLITALNTGHRGSMSTVHANSPEEAIWRIETLALLDGAASPDAIRRQLHAAVKYVVQVERDGYLRRVASIWRVEHDGGMVEEHG